MNTVMILIMSFWAAMICFRLDKIIIELKAANAPTPADIGTDRSMG